MTFLVIYLNKSKESRIQCKIIWYAMRYVTGITLLVVIFSTNETRTRDIKTRRRDVRVLPRFDDDGGV